MNKFEKLIEYVINDETAKARQLFHTIVVEKSRNIYEALDAKSCSVRKPTRGLDKVENFVDNVSAKRTRKPKLKEGIASIINSSDAKLLLTYAESGITEGLTNRLMKRVSAHYGKTLNESVVDDLDADSDALLDVAYSQSADEDDDEDDAISDFDNENDDEADTDEIEDRVIDLEDALDTLKAEFDELMAENECGMDDDEDDEDDEDEDDDDDDELVGEGLDSLANDYEDPDNYDDDDDDILDKMNIYANSDNLDENLIREYTEKVGHDWETRNGKEGSAVGNGRNTNINKRSSVAGKNSMGGTTKNIARGKAEVVPTTPTRPSNAYTKGATTFKGANKFENVPGGNAGKAFSRKEISYENSHGPEGKTTKGTVPVNKRSVVKTTK